jgi:hypothetical protein
MYAPFFQCSVSFSFCVVVGNMFVCTFFPPLTCALGHAALCSTSTKLVMYMKLL